MVGTTGDESALGGCGVGEAGGEDSGALVVTGGTAGAGGCCCVYHTAAPTAAASAIPTSGITKFLELRASMISQPEAIFLAASMEES